MNNKKFISVAKDVINLEIKALQNLKKIINNSFNQEAFPKNNKSPNNSDVYKVNKTSFSDDIKMMHEFIEFKYFKKVMEQNNNILE